MLSGARRSSAVIKRATSTERTPCGRVRYAPGTNRIVGLTVLGTRRILARDGHLADSLRSEKASAIDHKLPDQGQKTMLRRLADGREYHIVKRFHEPKPLQQRLVELGWSTQVQTTPEFFVYGHTTPAV
jgi:hypothetical protein